MSSWTHRSRIFHELRYFIGPPRLAFDQQITVGFERRAEREHSRMRAGINDTSVGPTHLIDAIAVDSTDLKVGFSQAFARKGLHRIPPKLCNPHELYDAGSEEFCKILTAEKTVLEPAL